ncbi:MAG: 2-oxoglutarate dehydrogenase E1 component, partial [Acidimicrobiia bacterium]
GKVYYDLAEKKAELKAAAPLVRIEQLYPFPTEGLRKVIEIHGNPEVFWVQEEPINHGAAAYVYMNASLKLGVTPGLIARDESASPASGSFRSHQAEQADLLERAFQSPSAPSGSAGSLGGAQTG